MRRIGSWLTVTCGVGLLTLVGNAHAQEALPKGFQGAWQLVEAGASPSCSAIDADIRMRVFGDRVDFHEGKCDVVSVQTSAEGTTAELELSCRGEGEEWNDRQSWALRQTDAGPALTLDWPDRDFSTVHYAPCASDGSEAAVTAKLCYENGNSFLSVAPVSDAKAEILIDSVQSRGAHMCHISGTADIVAGGLHYSEQIAGVGECHLDIRIGEDGSVSMKDRNSTCKAYHCGARAAFDNIWFTADEERGC